MPSRLSEIRSRSNAHPFEIRAKSKNSAEIVLYAPIGESFWGDSISAKQFSDELKKLDASVNEITVRINSPGGDVFDGITIYNRLKQHKAKIIVYIDGLAASIASIIALAGDEVIAGEGSMVMVHKPWVMAVGNSNDLEEMVTRLLDVEEQLVSIYAKKTKLERAEIKKMLSDETWMDSAQAIDLGFVDRVEGDSVPIAASVFDSAKWINKAPKTFKSETEFVSSAKDELKKKIEDRLKK